MTLDKHTIIALVEDKPGVLTRVASMFRRRGFNIANLAVGRSEMPGLSRMTFEVRGNGNDVEQVTKQLFKLIDVVKVSDITKEETVARELALIKVKAPVYSRSEIIQMVDIFRATIVDVASDSLIIEVTGDENKIDSIFNLLKPFGVKEMMRTGRVAMLRGMTGSQNNGTQSLQAVTDVAIEEED